MIGIKYFEMPDCCEECLFVDKIDYYPRLDLGDNIYDAHLKCKWRDMVAYELRDENEEAPDLYIEMDKCNKERAWWCPLEKIGDE